jgi:hypothetical protein
MPCQRSLSQITASYGLDFYRKSEKLSTTGRKKVSFGDFEWKSNRKAVRQPSSMIAVIYGPDAFCFPSIVGQDRNFSPFIDVRQISFNMKHSRVDDEHPNRALHRDGNLFDFRMIVLIQRSEATGHRYDDISTPAMARIVEQISLQQDCKGMIQYKIQSFE